MSEHQIKYQCYDRRTCPDTDLIAHKAAEAAVREVFKEMGINVDDPEKLEEFRKDLRLSNQLRKVADKGFFALIFTGMTVFLVTGVYTIYSKFHGG